MLQNHEAHGIRVVNFRYASLDGKLRELRLPVTDRATLAAAVVSGVVATLAAGLANNAGLLVGAFSGIAAGTVVALRTEARATKDAS